MAIAPLRTYEEAMLLEAQTWRRSLRAPLGVRCACREEPNAPHKLWCWWTYAVGRVYELERALGL